MPHTKKRPIHSWWVAISYHFFPPSSSLPRRKLAVQWFWSHEVATAHRDKQQQTSGCGGETFWVLTTWAYVKCQNMNSNRTPPRLQELGAIWNQQFLCCARHFKHNNLFFVFCKLTDSYTALKQLNSLCEFIKSLRVKKTPTFFWIRKLNGWILYITWPQSSIGAKFPRGSKGTGGRPRPAMPLP